MCPPQTSLPQGAEHRKGLLWYAGSCLRMKQERGPRSPPVYSQSSGVQAVPSPDHQTPNIVYNGSALIRQAHPSMRLFNYEALHCHSRL